jgi:spore coat polysaccharide biosynthesis protein SpsF
MKRRPRIVLLIQARMGSTRLPGKHFKEVLDRPLISFVVERLKRTKLVDQIVMATTLNPKDEKIVQFCQSIDLPFFRGSEHDVLDRYLQAAKSFNAEVIVRISGDCPLIDPAIVDEVIDCFLHHYPNCDYASNTLQRTFPRGMDAEVFSLKSLEKVAHDAKAPEEREHVTPFFYNHPELFKLKSVTKTPDDSRYRWTVDTEEDFLLIKTVLEDIYPRQPKFTCADLLQLFRYHPNWVEINAHIQQKPLTG